MNSPSNIFCAFSLNVNTTTDTYTLSLHDALPICIRGSTSSETVSPSTVSVIRVMPANLGRLGWLQVGVRQAGDRKSTRLNSSHSSISYAVFCLKKKSKQVAVILDMSPDTVNEFTLQYILRVFIKCKHYN